MAIAATDPLGPDRDWLAHRFDGARGIIRFLRVTREDHRAATFLDDEYLGARPHLDVPIAKLASAQPGGDAPVHFIFHSAFCCSTLLARAFDLPGRSIGLKEPKILNDLALEAHQRRLRPDIVALVLGLLARTAAPGETLVVKPSNEANILIEPLLAARPASKAILLSSPLQDFLYSVAKKGMWGRIWARRQHGRLRTFQRRDPGFSATEMFEQTDLQIAAMAWLMQRAQFLHVASAFPDRARSLDSEQLLASKATILQAAADWFGIAITSEDAAGIAGSDIFAEHAKEIGRRYDPAVRDSERDALRLAHRDEIDMVLRWAEAVAGAMQVPMTQTSPLTSDAPAGRLA